MKQILEFFFFNSSMVARAEWTF